MRTLLNNRNVFLPLLAAWLLGGAACQMEDRTVSGDGAEPEVAAVTPTEPEVVVVAHEEAPTRFSSINGIGTFGGGESAWSATLTPREEGVYDAVFTASWGNSTNLTYIGTIKTDSKTTLSGEGRASGGGANGTFEFSVTYGEDGLARGTYQEVGGGRTGAMIAELPR